jgi:hypothetical protein
MLNMREALRTGTIAASCILFVLVVVLLVLGLSFEVLLPAVRGGG